MYTACYISNRILYKNQDKTPYELWKNKKPNLNYFKVWRCIAYILNIANKRAKLESEAIKSFFIGYSLHNKAYGFLNLKTNTISEAMHVIYLNIWPLRMLIN